MQCNKCGNSFSKTVWLDGKQRSLQRRKYCLDCSPYGQYNNRKLENIGKERYCQLCNKLIVRKNEKGKYCWVCTNRKNREDKLKKVQQYTGNACWICGYNRCWEGLDFHHVYPDTKSFSLTKREMQFTWEKIFNEIQKCILACSCCHREIHAGLIANDVVEKIWKEKWVLVP